MVAIETKFKLGNILRFAPYTTQSDVAEFSFISVESIYSDRNCIISGQNKIAAILTAGDTIHVLDNKHESHEELQARGMPIEITAFFWIKVLVKDKSTGKITVGYLTGQPNSDNFTELSLLNNSVESV